MESQWPIWPWNKYIFTGSKCIIHFLVNSVEWVCLCIRCDRLCVCALSCFSCIWPFVTPWTIAHQAPLSLGFARQEYWSGLSCPPPGALPDPGIEPRFPAFRADSLPSQTPGKPKILESVAMPSSRGSSQPRYRTQVSCTAGGFFTIWVTRKAQSFIKNYLKREIM